MAALSSEWTCMLDRWLEMPLSALLCLMDLCFLSFNNNNATTSIRPIGGGIAIPAPPMLGGIAGGILRAPFGDAAASNDTLVDITKDSSITERLDAMDIEALLKNTRLFNSYLKCMLETGPCTAEGRELKREMLEVLHTGCQPCSEKTKTRLKKSFLRIKSDPRFRESYKKVLDKYDPDKIYISNLETFIAR